MGAAQDLGVRIGFAGGTTLTTVEQVRSDVRWASQAGLDSYWVSYVTGVDPLVALPLAANDAPRIELGTSVVPTVGRHPIAMAQLARTAQQVCGGRFTLGIGPSHQVVVEAMYGEYIRADVTAMLDHFGAHDVELELDDQGALPWVMSARIECALRRAGYEAAAPGTVPCASTPREPTTRDRRRRSRLYLPGNEPKFMLNAGFYGADALILDLED